MRIGVLTMLALNVISKKRVIYKEGEPTPAPTPAPTPGNPAPTPNPGPNDMISKAEHDRLMAGMRKAKENEVKAVEGKLLELQAKHEKGSKEHTELQTQIETLRSTYTSEKELAEQKIKNLQQQANEQLETVTKERDTFRTKWETTMIEHELAREEAAADPLVAGQLSKFLRPDTKLVDEVGTDGKLTGKQVVKVDIQDFDEKTGAPVTLTLTVKDALKHMRGKPQKYGNFFKGVGVGGIGGSNAGGNGAANSAPPKDTASYVAERNAKRGSK